jgi:hypothetical protein
VLGCTEGSGLRPDPVVSLDHGAAAVAPHDRHDGDLDEPPQRRVDFPKVRVSRHRERSFRGIVSADFAAS